MLVPGSKAVTAPSAPSATGSSALPLTEMYTPPATMLVLSVVKLGYGVTLVPLPPKASTAVTRQEYVA